MIQIKTLFPSLILRMPFLRGTSLNKNILFAFSLLILALATMALSMEPATISTPSQVKIAFSDTDSLITVSPQMTAQSPDEGVKRKKIALDRSALGKLEIEQLSSYLSRKYKVADTAVVTLIEGAIHAAKEQKLDPLLILAVIAVESGFNPFAQSNMGAQGLMQVMTKVHEDRFERFGGISQALHPIANIRVGAEILAEYVRRGGSVEEGLKMYVGATGPSDGGYGAKVLSERARLASASQGKLDAGSSLAATVALNPTAPLAPSAAKISETALPTSFNTRGQELVTPALPTPFQSFEPLIAPAMPTDEVRKDQIAQI